MALISINRNPARRELRQFGLLFFPLFVGMVGWIAYTADSRIVPVACLCLAAVSMALGALRPAAIRPIWLATMYVTFPIGFVISHVMIAVVYYLVLTPAGLIMRMVRKDPLERAIDPAQTSYWVRRPSPPELARYFRQF